MKKGLNVQTNFWGKFRVPILISIAIGVVGYIVIYLIFRGDGFISVGKDLSKSDWLSFLGAYLSFVGTVIVSFIALFQSSYYNKNENERRSKEHRRCIQPIFSINIKGINRQIVGTAEIFDPSNPLSFPKHNNVELSFENVNSYPVSHVFIFDEYICSLLKSNEIKGLQCAYHDTDDARKWAKHLIILNDEYERNEQGIPMWFNICYEDIDGQAMYQTFELKSSGNIFYYSLEGVHEA